MKNLVYYKLFISLKQNTPHGFTVLGFLVRVFLYSGVLITLILPSIDDFGGQSFAGRNEVNAKNDLATINHAQQVYQFEMGHFANSLNQLQIPLRQGHYSFRIISPMIPVVDSQGQSYNSESVQSVFTIAQPTLDYSNKSYIAAIFIENSTGIVTGICRMNTAKTLPTMLPSLKDDRTIQCPPNSTLLR